MFLLLAAKPCSGKEAVKFGGCDDMRSGLEGAG